MGSRKYYFEDYLMGVLLLVNVILLITWNAGLMSLNLIVLFYQLIIYKTHIRFRDRVSMQMSTFTQRLIWSIFILKLLPMIYYVNLYTKMLMHHSPKIQSFEGLIAVVLTVLYMSVLLKYGINID